MEELSSKLLNQKTTNTNHKNLTKTHKLTHSTNSLRVKKKARKRRNKKTIKRERGKKLGLKTKKRKTGRS